MGVILDTSVFIEAERFGGGNAAMLVPESLTPLGRQGPLGMSVLTLTEIAYGYERNQRFSQEQKDRLMAALRDAYDVYPVIPEIAIRAGRLNSVLRKNGTPIGLADVLIAATALELGFGVLTHNTRHFHYVPDLRILGANNL